VQPDLQTNVLAFLYRHQTPLLLQFQRRLVGLALLDTNIGGKWENQHLQMEINVNVYHQEQHQRQHQQQQILLLLIAVGLAQRVTLTGGY